MQLPPDLQTATAALTAGAANVLTNGAVLAAPGATNRLRVWNLSIRQNGTAVAAGQWFFDLTDAAIARIIGSISSPDFRGGSLDWPGGCRMATNVGLGYQLQSAVGAAVVVVTVGYTIEEA